jgi:hypothetical protein
LILEDWKGLARFEASIFEKKSFEGWGTRPRVGGRTYSYLKGEETVNPCYRCDGSEKRYG